jgi:hypothetical protein
MSTLVTTSNSTATAASTAASKAPLNVSVSTVIPAVTPAALYDIVADIRNIPKFSPETVETEWIGGATSAEVGARFKGTNRLGTHKWSTKPTITEATRGEVFSFKVPGKSGPTWTYRFEACAEGTRVTESVQQDRRSPLPIRLLQRHAGVTDRSENLRAAMHTTLTRIAASVA